MVYDTSSSMTMIKIFLITIIASWYSVLATTDDVRTNDNELVRSPFVPKFICPAIYGTFPHPTDCTKYYECRFGLAYERTCSKKKYFDEKKGVCRNKDEVTCNKNGDEEETTTEPPQKDFRCPYFWGVFAHPVDCSRYYVCGYGIATSFQCRKSELFDEKRRRCRNKKDVNCGNRLDRDQITSTREPTISTEPTPTEPGEDDFRPGRIRFFCPFNRGKYADPNDCAQYYECHFFITRPHRCPRSTLYDERKERCRDASKVRCGFRPGGIREDPKPKEITCPYAWGTFAHPQDCSKYILCLYNVPTVMTCRIYELFNMRNRRCASKESTQCQNRINPDVLDPETTTIAITTPEDNTDTEPPTVTDEPSTIPETEPTTFSDDTEPPTIPETEPTVETTPPPPTPEPTTTEEVPTTTIEPTTMTNMPPPNDCEEDDVDCIIDETKDIDKWFTCPERYGQFPHMGSSQLFIYCENWRPYIKRCATGTYFSLSYYVCTTEDMTF